MVGFVLYLLCALQKDSPCLKVETTLTLFASVSWNEINYWLTLIQESVATYPEGKQNCLASPWRLSEPFPQVPLEVTLLAGSLLAHIYFGYMWTINSIKKCRTSSGHRSVSWSRTVQEVCVGESIPTCVIPCNGWGNGVFFLFSFHLFSYLRLVNWKAMKPSRKSRQDPSVWGPQACLKVWPHWSDSTELSDSARHSFCFC